MPEIEIRCNNKNTKDSSRSCENKYLAKVTISDDWNPKTQLYFLVSDADILNIHHDATVDPRINMNGHRVLNFKVCALINPASGTIEKCAAAIGGEIFWIVKARDFSGNYYSQLGDFLLKSNW